MTVPVTPPPPPISPPPPYDRRPPPPVPPAKGPGLLTRIAPYRKVLVAVAGAALTWALAFYGPSNQWVSLGFAIATALGVYETPNAPRPGRGHRAGNPGGSA